MSSGMHGARLAALVLLAGCGSVLGIEELSSEGGDASTGDPGGSGDSGRGGNAGGGNAGRGGSAGSGNAGSGGSGEGGMDGGAAGSGTAGSGGSNAGSGGSGNAGSGNAGSGGSDTAGSGGSSDDGGMPDTGMPASPDVHGKVIDYYRNPVKSVVVKIGSVMTTTDADGKFTVADVSASYDVALTINAQRYGGNQIDGWLFVGLKRRDPTLQVFRGQPLVSGEVQVTTNNTTFPLPADDDIGLSFGSTWGDAATTIDAMLDPATMSWEGPAAINGTAHALRWSNANTAPYNPVTYHAADNKALSLNTTVQSTLTLDLGSAAALSSGTVAGTVTAQAFNERTNAVFLRYTDNAAIQLVNQYSAPDTFSYVVPSGIADTSIVVAATVNTPGRTPFAVAYKDGITAGTNGIALDVPSPATQIAPGAGSMNVDGETVFSWTGSDQVYVLHAESDDFYEGYYVVTTAKEARLPLPPLTNLPLLGNANYLWSVSTHLTKATVDDAAGPEGFLDAYCYGAIGGPSRGAGTHTESPEFLFKSK